MGAVGLCSMPTQRIEPLCHLHVLPSPPGRLSPLQRGPLAARMSKEKLTMRESPGRGRSLPTLEGIGAPGLGTGKDQGTQGGRRLGAYRRARTDQAARVERPRPKSAHGRAGGPTYWALRLLVVVSMVAGLVAEGVTGVTPASASSVPLWSQVTGAGGPAALSGAAMAYDPGTGQTIMFGGNASGTAQGITWNWNGSTSTWAQLTPLSSPSARTGPPWRTTRLPASCSSSAATTARPT